MPKQSKVRLRIANNSTQDNLLKLYKDAALKLRANAELDGVKGLQFDVTPHGVLPREDIPSAGKLAESNDGMLAHSQGFNKYLDRIRNSRETEVRERYERKLERDAKLHRITVERG